MTGIVGSFVVGLLFSITTSLTVAAQMLGVAAAQFCAAQAWAAAFRLPAKSKSGIITAVNIKKPILEFNVLLQIIPMASPSHESEVRSQKSEVCRRENITENAKIFPRIG